MNALGWLFAISEAFVAALWILYYRHLWRQSRSRALYWRGRYRFALALAVGAGALLGWHCWRHRKG